MPRQSNGQYVAPANTAAVGGATISSSAFNTLETDIGTEITNSVDRGGRSAMTAALPMGNQKITGMADPTVATDGATKNYIDVLVASFFSTGDVKLTLKAVADTGWIMFDDGTIGSATSGASTRANADTQALFTLLFNGIVDSFSPIFTSGGGATTRAAQSSASAAWAANCRISVPKTLGRALGVSGAGAGLTGRSFGSTIGEETHLLAVSEIPSHTHSGTTGTELQLHSHNLPAVMIDSGQQVATSGGAGHSGVNSASQVTSTQTSFHTHPFTTDAAGGGGAHNNMQPTAFLNAMVKL